MGQTEKTSAGGAIRCVVRAGSKSRRAGSPVQILPLWWWAGKLIAGWSSPVARQAHNLKVAGSNPAPATNFRSLQQVRGLMGTGNLYQVYVLQNTGGKYYIGLSEKVPLRVLQHNQGISKWTKKYRPWTLVWTSEHLNLSDARRLETRLKRQRGGVGFHYMTGLPRIAESG